MNSPATSRLLHVSLALAPPKFIAGKQTFMVSTIFIPMQRLIVRCELSSIEKQTFHLGKPHSINAAEFAAIRLVYDQLCADNHVCLVMLLAAELKRLSLHVVSLSIFQQHILLVCISKHCVLPYHPQGEKQVQ